MQQHACQTSQLLRRLDALSELCNVWLRTVGAFKSIHIDLSLLLPLLYRTCKN